MFNLISDTQLKFIILGDLILDRYIEGHVKRISPEAPVPVLLQNSERDVLGGAGNVANNIRALGADAYLVGVLGQDDAAKSFMITAEQSGTKLVAVIDSNRRTTVKTRLLGGRQQLLRVDCEDNTEVSENIQLEIIEKIRTLISQVNAIIISDYRKGALTAFVLQSAIDFAKENNVPIFVDPKGNEFINYIGADYIKPNRNELELLTKLSCLNTENVLEAASFLSRETNANILVTLSQEGMILFKNDGSQFSLPTQAREVFDVSGAGDTAIASFAFAICHGETAENAARFANISSGIAVSKIGTAAVPLHEILIAASNIYAHHHDHIDSHVELTTAVRLCEDWKKQGLKIGFTNGCFDLLHPGHISLLRSASKECDRLIVGLNSDASVGRLKGSHRPIQTESARAEVLRAIDCVDLVVIFDENTPLETIKSINPDVLIKGSDYEEKDIVGAEYVKSYGGRITRVELREGHSTTNLVKRSNLS